MTTSSRASKRLGSTTGSSQQQQQQHQQQQSNQNGVIDMALATLQPLRDLSRNWDVDVASWYVPTNIRYGIRDFKLSIVVQFLSA